MVHDNMRGMVNRGAFGPEELSFGTGTAQCRHKTAVLRGHGGKLYCTRGIWSSKLWGWLVFPVFKLLLFLL